MSNNFIMFRSLVINGCFQVLLGLILSQLAEGDCPFPKQESSILLFEYENYRDANKSNATELYVLKFRCRLGYSLIGESYILCLDGEWDGSVPNCEALQCPDPPDVGNATYKIDGGENGKLPIRSSVTYSCKFGYEFVDVKATTLRCELDRKSNTAVWKGIKPFCKKRISCPDPAVSVNGKREGPCCFSGDILQFYCHEEYELVGSEKIQCLSNGTWSSVRPLCRPLGDHCDFPPPIPHGIPTGKKKGDYFVLDEEIRILCEPGYAYRGPSEFVSCDEGGEWDEEFGECTEIFCDPPASIEKGTIPELQEANFTIFPNNFGITYVCDKGYRLLGGDSWSICGKKGWSGKTPRCEEIECPDPGVPEHGDRIAESFKIGAKVRFKCFTGYDLLGSIDRYCMSNGQWSGELTRCDTPGNYCPNPGIPVNGFKSSNSYNLGDKVRFYCTTPHFLVGSEVRECLHNRTWSGTEARCISPYDFDNKKQISEILQSKVAERFEEEQKQRHKFQQAVNTMEFNGSIIEGRRLDMNFQGMLIIYFAFDASGSVGITNFQTSIEFAKAIVKKVGVSNDRVRVGAVTFSSKVESKFVPNNFNSTDDVLQKLDEIKYTGGGTAANSALHFIRTETMPVDLKWFEGINIKTVIFLLTDGKANMGGNPREEADLLKKAGVEIYCIGITGDIRKETLYRIASISKDSKEGRPNVFILENYNTMSWLVDELTNGTLDYSKCGLGMRNIGTNQNLARILNGKNSDEPWPWMAALYFLPEGEKSFEKAQLECGGSIINENFILTAAHCMYEIRLRENYIRKRDKSEIIVKLGLSDIKNETYVQEFEIIEMHIHSKYTAGPSHDYDIALLQLDRPIQYSRFVRPICLVPDVLPKNSSFYSPQENYWATGWGHEGIVPRGKLIRFKTSRYLKELRLPIQSRETCIDSLKKIDKNLEQYFTDRMFCAGDGLRGNDTCHGDSGGPLMQAQWNSEGYIYWTQVGIVSWGTGCGLKGTYGYYTHLQTFRRWIDEQIQLARDKL